MDYSFTQKEESQREPLRGHELEMKENLAGGYAFRADSWQVLKRWLLVGSMRGAFYQGREEMTEGNVDVLKACVAKDAGQTAQMIVDASKKGTSIHTPIFALGWLSKLNVAAFRAVFNGVIRNASHLYEFLSYVKGIRGWGRGLRGATRNWLNSKEVSELEYQFLKYQNRYGFTGRDALRLIKPTPANETEKNLYAWVVGKDAALENLSRLAIYEALKAGSVEDVSGAIKEHRLTHEMIPANIERTKKVWQALFEQMPVGATIRNLGNLTDKGIFDDWDNINHLKNRLTGERLRKAYIHPIALAMAYQTYSAGGGLGKSKLTWEPKQRVQSIVMKAINESFDYIQPTGKAFLHGIDVSGSMGGGWYSDYQIAGFTPCQIAAIMALATIKAEEQAAVIGFANLLHEISPPLHSEATYNDAINIDTPGGATDAALVFEYAIKRRLKVDVFIVWTDMQTWEGQRHPTSVLREYRNRINKDAKAIYVALVPYTDGVSLGNPKNPLDYDIAGFTSETPKLIQMIAGDEI